MTENKAKKVNKKIVTYFVLTLMVLVPYVIYYLMIYFGSPEPSKDYYILITVFSAFFTPFFSIVIGCFLYIRTRKILVPNLVYLLISVVCTIVSDLVFRFMIVGNSLWIDIFANDDYYWIDIEIRLLILCINALISILFAFITKCAITVIKNYKQNKIGNG